MYMICPRCKSFSPKSCKEVDCPIKKLSFPSGRSQLVDTKDIDGQSPSTFVGSTNYPHLNVGIMATNKDNHHDDPKHWISSDATISDVLNKRQELLNSQFKANATRLQSQLIELGQEIVQGIKAADIEVELDKKPQVKLSFFRSAAPTGPRASILKAQLTSNIKIPKVVDKWTSDTEAKAQDALTSMYTKGLGEHELTKLLSMGTLGQQDKRKLVPTRWSITATDDTLGKSLIDKVRELQEAGPWVGTGTYFGNYFIVIHTGGPFRYELFEIAVPKEMRLKDGMLPHSTDFEDALGRTKYAQETEGGYYASRIGVLEGLIEKKRQSGVLVLRFITEEYWAPLGVWVVREATRRAAHARGVDMSSVEECLSYAKKFAKSKFNLDLNLLLKKSKLLRALRQRSLTSFM